MFLEKNLVSLGKRFPHYVEAIRNAPVTGRYVLQKSAVGSLNVVDRNINVQYYNNVDPMVAVENELTSRNILVPNIGIFLGFGLGYHAISYLKKFKNIELIAVFERDLEIIKLALINMDFGNFFVNPALVLCLGQHPNEYYPPIFTALQQGTAKLYMQSINFIDSASVSAYQDYYMACVRTIKDGINGTLNLYGNDPHDSMIGIKNTFHNISTIIENAGIKDLKGVFKNKPGIVVSAGPSLDKNIHLLHGLEDKAVIVAADTSLKIMLKHGLKPHMATSLERILATAALFKDLTEEDVKDVYFSACPVIMPETYANYPGEKIIVYRNFATFKWLDIDKGVMDIGPSAGNMAYKILEYLGCDPIILIGQDLAFDGNISHAKGSHYGVDQSNIMATGGFIEVEGNYLPKVRTTVVWEMFLKYYQNDVAKFQGKVINATEGGAKILGTELMTFQEAIDQYIQKPIGVLSTIKKKLNKPFKAQQDKDFAATRRKVTDAIEYCQSVLDRYLESLAGFAEYQENVVKKWNAGDQNELEAKSAEYLANMERSLGVFGEQKFFLILMHYVQSYFIKSMLEVNAIKADGKVPNVVRTDRVMVKLAEMYVTLGNLVSAMKIEFDKLLKHLDERG